MLFILIMCLVFLQLTVGLRCSEPGMKQQNGNIIMGMKSQWMFSVKGLLTYLKSIHKVQK